MNAASYFTVYHEIIPDFDLFQESLRHPLPIHLRLNSLKAPPSAVLGGLQERGIRLRPSMPGNETLYLAPGLDSPGNLLEYFLGYIHPQAFASCLAAVALRPLKGTYVLDLCASPGGKCTHLSQFMDNTGLLIANEPYAGRRIPLGHTLDRLGVCNTVVTGYPAQEFPLRQRFDFILADVPCSGEGRFRKAKAGSHYRQDDSGRGKLIELQKRILLRAFDLLKEGGELLYSTCTYNPGENESVVQSLLDQRQAELLPMDLGVPVDPGLTLWQDKRYDRRMERAARLYPHRLDTVGFFMARIGRGI